MSQTAINRMPNLKTKEFNSITTSEILSATNSTKESPGVRTDFVTSPSDQQFTMNTEDTEEYTVEDIKQLEDISQRLTNEVVHKQDFRGEIQKTQDAMEKIMKGNLPAAIKANMIESLMETLRTNMNCIRENNRVLRDKIEQNNEKKENEQDLIAKKEQEKVKIAAAQKLIKELQDDNQNLEETIAQLKQERNVKLVTIEDLRDDVEDMQALIKEKKNALDRKTRLVEEVKIKISKDSVNKALTSRSGNMTHRKTNSEAGPLTLRNHLGGGEKNTDTSMSKVNTSVFQEMSSKIMSSKLGQVFGKFGKVLGVRKEEAPGTILTNDFLKELDLQSASTSLNSSKVLSNQSQSYMSNFSKPYGHGRNLSINNYGYEHK